MKTTLLGGFRVDFKTQHLRQSSAYTSIPYVSRFRRSFEPCGGTDRHPLWFIQKIQCTGELDHPGKRPGGFNHPSGTLEIPTDGIAAVTVKPGDTLSAIALEFRLSPEDLRRVNGLSSDAIHAGQKINIPIPAPRGKYRVLPGDTLLAIALRHEVDPDDLKMYNDLKDDTIRPGQILVVEAQRPEGHKVAAGESLWSISTKYGVDIEKVREWNDLEGDNIRPGDVLVLFPGITEPKLNDSPPVVLASAQVQKPDPVQKPNPVKQPEQVKKPETTRLPGDGEYYFSIPEKENQPSTSYWESPDATTAEDYRRARQVLDEYFIESRKLPALSRTLKGWHIVLDPGHGGLDPGAIVSVPDGRGNPLVITEDEYAYDIALRLGRALLRHGASVDFTLIAPDHHIRNGTDARATFVHRKNEVYNDENHNQGASWRPVGTVAGLELRNTITSRSIAKTPVSERRLGTVFISVHADNSSDLPEGKAVLFDGADEGELESSRALALAMTGSLGSASFVRQQPLMVLKNNPADAAVLVEARNIHYPRNAWALRSDTLREQDAMMICKGILAWAESRKKDR